MDEIECELCEAYYNLSENQKKKFENSIPIKILIRLKNKHLKLTTSRNQDEEMLNSECSNISSYAKF